MKTKTKKVCKRKQRKTRFHRKNRKLQRFISILEKNRQNAYKQSLMVGGVFGLSQKEKDAKAAKEAARKAEEAKEANIEQKKELQQKEDFGKIEKKEKEDFGATDQQKLLAHKNLKSAFEKSEEAKLTKEMEYQKKYNNRHNAMEASGKTALAFAVANAAVGVLAATGIGLPAAGGIAVCLIIVSKIMKKVKELQELRIIMLDINIILTNCYYLENMINKVLTIFQIYINDTTENKEYFRKIITVDEYTELNNSCKNIKMLVDENKNKNTTHTDEFIKVASNTIGNISTKSEATTTTTTTTNTTTNKKPKYSDFIKKTKNLKGYNLGERIQNAKQLYITNNHDINAVINAEKVEYETFGTALKNNGDYINIDDDDALESLMKYMIYTRIETGLKGCNTTDKSATDKFYDKESKHIYQIGVDPDIKFRIKQKLNIIRDLLIEIDPSAAQDTMKSVDLNESLDKVEDDAFTELINTNKLDKTKNQDEINRKKKIFRRFGKIY